MNKWIVYSRNYFIQAYIYAGCAYMLFVGNSSILSDGWNEFEVKLLFACMGMSAIMFLIGFTKLIVHLIKTARVAKSDDGTMVTW